MNDGVLRVVTTADFLGAFAPAATSYGFLPGGHGLQQAVHRLKEKGPVVWIDTGDFAAGPIASLAGPDTAYQAAAELGIDVACVGNHEYDWGLSTFETARSQLSFPVVAANMGSSLPSHSIVETPAGRIAVIGLTIASIQALAPTAPAAEEVDPRDVIDSVASQDVDWTVLAVHDGVDWQGSSGRVVTSMGRLEDLVDPWTPYVDLIVGGHTLGRGPLRLSSSAFLQPWGFGVEIGIAELRREGQVSNRYHRVCAQSNWRGAGADRIAEAAAAPVGTADIQYRYEPGRRIDLLEKLARGLAQACGSEGALVTGASIMTQPPSDGCLAAVGPGIITEYDIHRLAPWSDDSVVLCTVDIGALYKAMDSYASPPFHDYGIHLSAPGRTLTIAIQGYHWDRIASTPGLQMADPISSPIGIRQALTAAFE